MEERHEAILTLIAQNGSITTAEIQRRFSVSYDSAKRDLRILEEKGLLRRTHGGAIPLDAVGTAPARRSGGADSDTELSAVADHALSLLKSGDTVFLPSGEFGTYMAKNIPAGLGIKAAVNSPKLAELLIGRGDVGVIMPGGEPCADGCFYGGLAVSNLRLMRFDKVFLDVKHISPDFGISVHDGGTVQFFEALTRSAKKLIALCRPGSFGVCALYSICQPEKTDVMLCPPSAGEAELSEYNGLGIRTVICK